MTEADIEQIVELEKQIFTMPWSKQAFEEEMDNQLAHYYVAIVNDEIVGYLGYWQVLNEAHITNIGIAPQHRRKGYASKLLMNMLGIVEENDIESITLEVRASNYNAQSLYKKFGFVEAGRRKNYYLDNKEDAIIMWLEF